MKVRLFLALSALCVLLTGCNKSEEKVFTPMGDAAPAFGSAGKADLQTFLVGDWCFVDPMGEPVKDRYYKFSGDGKFECGRSQDHWTSTGSWTVTGTTVMLTYQTMKGKAYEDFRAGYKKDEEGGGQVAVRRALFYDGLFDQLARQTTLWVDEDQKHLVFNDPSQKVDPSAAGGELGDLANMVKDQSGLERITESKE